MGETERPTDQEIKDKQNAELAEAQAEHNRRTPGTKEYEAAKEAE